MHIFQAIILGLVQGLSEFLPVSSSGHLIIVPWLFHWPDPGLGFDVALHWGTLVAVLGYFWRDALLIIKGFWHSLFKSTRSMQNNIYQKLAWLLIAASVPGAVIGKLLESKAESAFRNPLLVASTMAGIGLILYATDRYAKKVKDLGHISVADSVIIGFSQALAVIPGVSRSGSTITAGLLLGFKREDAAKFSFLMSIPIIFGAGILKLKEFHTGVTTGDLLAGFISSVIFGVIAIKFMFAWLRRADFKIFVWYRLAFSFLIVAIYCARLR